MKRLAALAVAFLAAATGEAQIQRAPPAGGAQGPQLAQLQAERDALRSENAQLKQEVEKAKATAQSAAKQADSVKGNSAAGQRALAAAQATIKSQEDALAQSRDKLQDLVGKFRETTATLAGVETERGQLKQKLVTSLGMLDQCAQRNVALADLSEEVLTRLEKQGFGAALASAEPFTRQHRTRIENLVDDYRARVAELHAQKPPVDAGSVPTSDKTR